MTIERQLSYAKLTVQMICHGSDYSILLGGGDSPHIGCTVLAVPRPSLEAGKQEGSSTASVLNVTGHKDELLCRYLAERVAAETGAVVVCSGGFHVDGITQAQIAEVTEAAKDVAEELLKTIC